MLPSVPWGSHGFVHFYQADLRACTTASWGQLEIKVEPLFLQLQQGAQQAASGQRRLRVLASSRSAKVDEETCTVCQETPDLQQHLFCSQVQNDASTSGPKAQMCAYSAPRLHSS